MVRCATHSQAWHGLIQRGLIRFGGGCPGGDGETFDGVGGEAVEDAADDAEAGLGGGEAHAESGVFGFLRHVPAARGLLELALETVSRDLAGEMGFLLLGDFGLGWEDLAEPFGDTADDLADASVGDVVQVGLGAGGTAGDVDGVVDLEVAFRWGDRDSGLGARGR